MNKSTFNVPLDVIALSKVMGESLKVARKRRRMTQDEVAMRIGATRDVVIKAEQGKSVTSYNLCSLLWLYGLLNQAVGSVAPERDVVGVSLEKSRLPDRIRQRKAEDDF